MGSSKKASKTIAYREGEERRGIVREGGKEKRESKTLTSVELKWK